MNRVTRAIGSPESRLHLSRLAHCQYADLRATFAIRSDQTWLRDYPYRAQSYLRGVEQNLDSSHLQLDAVRDEECIGRWNHPVRQSSSTATVVHLSLIHI